MPQEQAKAETTLELKRVFAAPPQKVFEAFTRPEALKRWWVPFENYALPEADIDLRVGGSYRLSMQNDKGELFYLCGTYREVNPPHRLSYTWRWEDVETDNTGETLVTLELREVGDATELLLIHEAFPTSRDRDNHERGWGGCLEKLPDALRD